jgi:predicted DNA-binding helix-hairpin-helix protein
LFYNTNVDDLQKLKLLSSASLLEAGEDGCRQAAAHPDVHKGIVVTDARLPNGKVTRLLKSLLSSYCENNCLYCPFRSARDIRRDTWQPEEFARMVINLTNAGLIQGVFLSSGVVNGGVFTQDKLIATAEILRHKMDYRGYLHLKIMPGAEFDQVAATMRLADRVSINLEAPNEYRLPALAPQKRFNDQLFTPLKWVDAIRHQQFPAKAWKGRWPSSSTQFVVGGAGESDIELLEITQTLHHLYGLRRAYYSAFKPHYDTPLESHAPVPLKRELRLYQADYLIRDYGFSREELIFDRQENLPLEYDPKEAWARQCLSEHPLEVNRASREELLRVPGIGPKGVQAILKARRWHTLRDLSCLARIGVNTRRAGDYLLLDGSRAPRQLCLFPLD